MYERLIIDGNSVYEVDEECLKRRNVPAECRVKEAVERQIQKEKARLNDRRVKLIMASMIFFWLSIGCVVVSFVSAVIMQFGR